MLATDRQKDKHCHHLEASFALREARV